MVTSNVTVILPILQNAQVIYFSTLKYQEFKTSYLGQHCDAVQVLAAPTEAQLCGPG